jgi:hypothetical protein
MFIAESKASMLIHAFVNIVNDHVFTPVLKWPAAGLGVERAAKRLTAERKATAKRLGKLAKVVPSRQVKRAQARFALKSKVHAMKAHISKTKVLGGSAILVRGQYC